MSGGRRRIPKLPSDVGMTHDELRQEAERTFISFDALVFFLERGPDWIDRQFERHVKLPEDLLDNLLELTDRGMDLLARVSPHFSGLGSEANATRYMRLWHALCQVTFSCDVRISNGKTGEDAHYNVMINLTRRWNDKIREYFTEARTHQFQRMTIYQTFWRRAFSAMLLWAYLLCDPVRDGVSIVTFHTMKLGRLWVNHSPDGVAADDANRIRVQMRNDVRPPLPHVNWPLAFNNPDLRFHPRIKFEDWIHRQIKRMAIRQVRRSQDVPRSWSIRDGDESFRRGIPVSDWFAFRGTWHAGHVLCSGTMWTAEEQHDSYFVDAPFSRGQNSTRTMDIELRSMSMRKIINATSSTGDAHQLDAFRLFKVAQSDLPPHWKHATLFVAALVTWYTQPPDSKGRPATTTHHAALVARTIDIETMWHLGIVHVLQGPAGRLKELIEEDDRYADAWRDATERDIADGEVLQRMMMILRTRIKVLMFGREEEPNLYSLQQGILLFLKFAMLRYERFLVLEEKSSSWLTRSTAPRPAQTIEEILSYDWPGYNEHLDILSQISLVR